MRTKINPQTINKIFLICALCIFPFGNILRFPVGYGVSVVGLDLVVGCILICSLAFVKTYVQTYKKISIWFAVWTAVAIASLLFNTLWLGPIRTLIAALYLLRFVAYINIFWICKQFSTEDKKRLRIYAAISGFTFVILSLMQYALYPDLRNLYYLGWDEHLYRLFGTIFDPNFAGALLMIIFVQLYSVSQEYKKQWFSKIPIVLTAIAFFLTYSRSAYLAACAMLAVYAVRKKSWYIGLLGCVIIIVGIISLPKNFGGEGVKLFRTASVSARAHEYSQAVSIWKTHPVFGIGFNAYRYAQLREGYINLETWEEDHAGAGVPNMYLFVLATTGIIGVCSLLALMWALFQYTNASKALLLSPLFVGLSVHGLFENTLFYPFILFMFILTISLQEE